MSSFLNFLNFVEYCHIDNVYVFDQENAWNKAMEYLDSDNVCYEYNENSYVGLYMIKICEQQRGLN